MPDFKEACTLYVQSMTDVGVKRVDSLIDQGVVDRKVAVSSRLSLLRATDQFSDGEEYEKQFAELYRLSCISDNVIDPQIKDMPDFKEACTCIQSFRLSRERE